MSSRREKPRQRRPKKQLRKPKPRILVVCDGRTETFYFQGLQHHLGLTNVKVVAVPPQNSGVRGILARVRQKLIDEEGWDRIYCLFDVDEQPDNVNRLRRALTALSTGDLLVQAMLSDPCFEYWLLLHFKATDAPFVSMPDGKTAAKQVIDQLRSYIRHYTKTDSEIFNYCSENVEKAVQRASGHEVPLGEGRPATEVGKLVAYLLHLSQENQRK